MHPKFTYTTNVEKLFLKNSWKDCGNYWEHEASQGTEEWKNVRVGRVGSSKFGGFCGQTEHFKNGSPEEIGMIIAGLKEPVFEERNIKYMEHGNITESKTRIWYENQYKCKVQERGFCVPKFDLLRIGASIDGDILNSDGILEIKCPQKMYTPILTYMNMISQGWKPPKNYHDHIWDAHYSQCQHGMAVLGKKWCDYVVYSTSNSQIFTQRLFFDFDYWSKNYLIIKKNYDLYIKPFLKPDYPIMPKN